jgi:hypothetical protein
MHVNDDNKIFSLPFSFFSPFIGRTKKIEKEKKAKKLMTLEG